MFKLAIFDLDGTLCDTVADIFDALSAIFIKNSIQPPSLGEAKTLMGNGLKAFLDKACRLRGGFDCPPNIMDEFIHLYSENCTNKTSLYNGIEEVIESLNNNQIKCAVLSNKSEVLVKKILQYFQLTNNFIIISGGDTFAEKKPSPLPILETLRLTGFHKRDALMIGDSMNDINAGIGAGVKTCYCSYGYGENLPMPPDLTVKNPKEILNIFMEQR